MSWFLCMMKECFTSSRGGKMKLSSYTYKGCDIDQRHGKISLCACTGWGWTMVLEMNSWILVSRMSPPQAWRLLGRKNPSPSWHLYLAQDIWERKFAWSCPSPASVVALSREITPEDQDQAVCLGSSSESPSALILMHLAHSEHIFCHKVSLSASHHSMCSACKSFSPPWLNLSCVFYSFWCNCKWELKKNSSR